MIYSGIYYVVHTAPSHVEPLHTIEPHIYLSPFLTTASWIEQHGPLISLRAGTYRYVVIGRHQAAKDIMEKQGSVLADRPRLVASGELLGRGFRILHVPAGERLKRMRRAFHTHFQPKAVQTYEPLQMSHVKEMVLGLLESPEQYQNHARAYAASVILKVTYGKNTPTHASDPDVLQVRKSLARFAMSLRPGAYLVDSFPWLTYLPWYGRELRQGFIEDYTLFHRQLDAVKRQMNHPNSGPSFAKFLLAQEIDFGLNETEMAFLAGATFSAGVDTVLPTFDDEESLPVLCAFILESMRWRPLAPLGIAHRATEDIIWGDYCIPAGTRVFGNHWAISRNPDVFPNPDTFDLTRWLTSDGNLRNDIKFPAFGFGRRSLFINTVFSLWSFHLSVDESEPADVMAFLNGLRRDAESIGLHFKPRMAKEKLMMMMEQ
ncbi:cytochrome P450 [Boletus coccyginus]|nr:cytochrome P450 [Boletus coccyginus]